jgi:putative ABC transport system permease protein
VSGASIDWRHAARSLKRQPAFTCFAGLVLAIGIASVATMSAVIDAVDFPALPFESPRHIVLAERVVTSPDHPEGQNRSARESLFKRWQSARAFSAVAAWQYAGIGRLLGDDGNVMVPLNAATPNLFAALGVRPLLGRFVVPSDTEAGAPPVIVLSFEFWQREFSGRADALGKTIRLTDTDAGGGPVDYRVVGVLPSGLPEFNGLRGLGEYIPLRLADNVGADTSQVDVLGRLRTGVSIAAAQDELTRLAREVPSAPGEHTVGIAVRRLDSLYGYVAPARFSLLAIAVLVLAMAALNVANLVLARGAAHAQETALRIALGASSYRIARLFLAESAIIVVVGSAVAIPLAVWGSRTASVALGLTGGGWRIAPDARVFGVVFGVIAAVVLACGIPPAIAAARQGSRGIIRGVGHVVDGHASWRRLTDVLLVGQVAGALILVFGARLITREFRLAALAAPGIGATHALEVAFPFGLSHASGDDPLSRMVDALAAEPAVRSVGPWASTFDDTVEAAGVGGVVQRMPVEDDAVSAGTMRALGTSPMSGRLLDSADAVSAASVGVVNDVLAAALWPNQSAIGKSMILIRAERSAPARSGLARREVVRIVGVVRSIAVNYAPGEKAPAQFFQPFVPSAPADVQALFLQTRQRPPAAISDVRRAIQTVDAQDFFRDAVQPLHDRMADETRNLRFAARSLDVGALLAVIVATLGIYGFVAYVVSRRSREIAIRMALGASEWRAVRSILPRAAWLAVLGLVSGGVGCLGMVRILSRMSPGTASVSLDVSSLAMSVLAVLVVVAAATFAPAYRATQAGTAALRSA